MATIVRQPFAAKGKVSRIALTCGLAVIYAIGVLISGLALSLLPQGKETGPDGHSYPAWTAVHFASALLFAILAMLQLPSGLRRRWPLLHRYCGRVAVASGLIAALSGACIPFAIVPSRPLVERLFIVVYFSGVALCLLLGFRAARGRDFALHRIWMIRAVAAAGAVVTQRIAFTIFVLSLGFHSDAGFWNAFVGAFALGWAINFGLAEYWLRSTPLPRSAR